MDELTTILIDALKNIASYGDDGICPYGCDTPHIATEALVNYDNAQYKALHLLKRPERE